MDYRARRCELSTPASNVKMIQKGVSSKADLVFLDLEDSVAPQEKVYARKNVIEAFNNLDWGKKIKAFRINNVETEWCYKDIVEVISGARENVDVIIIPKVNSASDVQFVDILLTQVERELGLKKKIGLECLIETANAMENVFEIAKSSQRLEAIIFGPGDYSASVGIPLTSIGASNPGKYQYPGHRWHYPLNRMLVAARAAGIQVIDGPFAAFNDYEGYRNEAKWDASLGIDGKWAIHPNQIDICLEEFTPDHETTAKAKEIIRKYKEAEESGLGAVTFGNEMIDAATVKIAERILVRTGEN